MLGSPDQPGMIPRAMRQIFESSQRLEKQGWAFQMQASMLEIYNEELRDLLGKRPKASQPETKKHQVSNPPSPGAGSGGRSRGDGPSPSEFADPYLDPLRLFLTVPHSSLLLTLR